MFGPAILSGCVAKHKVSLVIQAKDAMGLDRVCGMDKFTVSASTVVAKKDKVLIEPLEELAINIVDQVSFASHQSQVY